MWLKWGWYGDSLFFLSGYVQPVLGVGCVEISHALRALGGAHQKCLGMDGNGHSPVWGPFEVSTNPQGILLENMMASEEILSLMLPRALLLIWEMMDVSPG